MRRLALTLFLSIILTTGAAAAPAGFSVALGSAVSSVAGDPVSVTLGANWGSAHLLFQALGDDIIDLDVRHSFRPKSNYGLETVVMGNIQAVPEDSGAFAGVGFTLGQDMKWGMFRLRWALGLQYAVSWSGHSSIRSRALSGLADLSLGLEGERFSSSLFVTFSLPEERSFMSLPCFGATASVKLDSHASLFAMGYFELGEILMNPDYLISAYGFKAGVRISGGGS